VGEGPSAHLKSWFEGIDDFVAKDPTKMPTGKE
jgi:hypothetical protein